MEITINCNINCTGGTMSTLLVCIIRKSAARSIILIALLKCWILQQTVMAKMTAESPIVIAAYKNMLALEFKPALSLRAMVLASSEASAPSLKNTKASPHKPA